jgi:hypothetical protein
MADSCAESSGCVYRDIGTKQRIDDNEVQKFAPLIDPPDDGGRHVEGVT